VPASGGSIGAIAAGYRIEPGRVKHHDVERRCSGTNFYAMPSAEKQPSNLVTDPDALAKMLEMELALKRAAWQHTRSRRGTWRALSILFLLLVIMGALVAYFYFVPALSRSGESTSPPGATDSTR
jgi:hypothetical protein